MKLGPEHAACVQVQRLKYVGEALREPLALGRLMHRGSRFDGSKGRNMVAYFQGKVANIMGKVKI